MASNNGPSSEQNSELERKIDVLFGAIDSDPYFSRLDEETQERLERELVHDLVDKESWTSRVGRREFLKNPVIKAGKFEFEPVRLPPDEQAKIRQTITEEFRNIDAENFSPRDELIERVAFNIIGKDYVKFGKEREELFLNDEKLHADFSGAWVKADSVYDESMRRFTRSVKPPSSSTPDTQPPIEVPYIPEVVEERKPGWISRHKGLVTGIIVGLVGGAGLYTHNFINSPKQKLLRFASENDIPKTTANDFYNSYPNMVSSFLKTDSSSLLPSIGVYSQNSSLFANIYKAAMNDPQITIDRNQVAAHTSELALDVGVTELTMPSVYTLGNLTVADLQLGLPSFGIGTVENLVNTTQQSPDLVDFRPIMITDSKGHTKVIKNTNIARDHFLAGKLIEQRPHLAEQPQMHEWVNVMIQQLAWDMFDSPEGPGFYDGVVYSPIDPSMQKIILDFSDYMEKLPEVLGAEGIEPPIHYNDSDLLRQQINDRTNRSIVLRYLAHLPAITFDKQDFIASGYDYGNKKNFVVRGKEAMNLFVRQLPEERDEIISSMKDPTIISYPSFQGTFYDWANERYVQWLSDRFSHGASYTVGQFLGFTDKDVEDLKNASGIPVNGEITNPRKELLLELIEKRYGIYQALEKNWSSWDLIKFVKGYERFSRDWVGEVNHYSYAYPLAYKSIGVPYGGITARPYIQGTVGSEWAISLPDNIIEHLKKELPDNKIVIGHGNLISLYSCLDGAKKDGITELIQDNGYASVPQNISPIHLWMEE